MKRAPVGLNGERIGHVRRDDVLKIVETFISINGEVNFRHQGSIAFFIRLAGCNLRCNWCDTKYAQDANKYPYYTVPSIIQDAPPVTDIPNITITGGEPLVQQECLMDMIEVFAKRGYYVNIETNGSISIPRVPHKIRSHIGWTIDIKMPSSGYHNWKCYENLPKDLCQNDWLKFVVANAMDIIQAKKFIKKHNLEKYNIAFSPVLVAGIQSKLFIQKFIDKAYGTGIISLQLHKMLGFK